LVRATPIEIGRPSSARTRRRTVFAISAGGPKRRIHPATSGKGLVDGNSLDEGCEVTQYLDGGIAEPLVLLEMATDKSELRTQLARPPSRHPAADPKGLGFIRSGEHNPTTNGDWPTTQRRVEDLKRN
jgi:hypothetical protein